MGCERFRVTTSRVLGGVIIALAGLLWVLPAPNGWPAETMPAAALTVFTIGFWATGALPEAVTSLAFLAVAMIAKTQPPSVIFAGFQSTAFWLIFGGLVIGAAVKTSGLGARLARFLVRRIGTSYIGILTGVVVVGGVLSFLIPGTFGRIVLFIPVVLALADELGLAPGRPGRTGMVMAAALSGVLPAFGILPAAIPGMVLAGSMEQLYGISLGYGDFLLLHFPVLGALKSFAILLVVARLFPDRIAVRAACASSGPWTREERRLALVLAVLFGLWLSDSLHQVSPGWVALGGAVILMTPMVGVVTPQSFQQDVPFSVLFHTAAMIGLGAMVAASGLAAQLGHGLIATLPVGPGADGANFAGLTLLASLVSLIATIPATPGVLTPLVHHLAEVTGWSPETVAMSQVLGYSTLILPYQAPPMLVALAIAGIPMFRALKATFVLALLTILFLLPLDYTWWIALGRFG